MFYGDRAKLVGERIKKERKEARLTQKELLEKIYLSETSVASLRAWERGERLPDMDTLARMCEVFNCDFGYLLGDYDEKDYSIHKIREYTGLSETSINNIHDANSDMLRAITSLPMLNKLLSFDEFWELVFDFSTFEHQSHVVSSRPKMIRSARDQGDADMETRLNKDYKFAITDKDVLLLGIQRRLFRIADRIEKEASK